MNPRDLRAMLERPWDALAATKREHWAREFAARGAEAMLEAAAALHEHMRLVRPEWPTEEQRYADLVDHVALKRDLDRVSGLVVALRPR